MAAPATVEERRLEDDVGAAAHRLERQRLGRAELVGRAQVVLGDLDDRQAAAAERGQVRRLVEVALRLDQRDRRVVLADRLLPEALDAPELECREMVAGEIADEVRGADDQGSVGGDLHASNRSSGP